MKRIWLLAVGVLMMVVLVACTSKDNDEVKEGIESNYVNAQVILKDIKEEKSFAFSIVDKDCSACQAYKAGALKEFEEETPGAIRYIEINGIENNNKDLEDIQTLISEHLDGQFEATPTTYFIRDGKMSEAMVGAVTYEELLERYDENLVK